MNTKTITFAAITALLVFSVMAVSELSTAEAKNEPEPDFEAKLQGFQQTVPTEKGTGHGKAKFWWADGEDALYYEIEVSKNYIVTWNGQTSKGNGGDTITKIHFHNNVPGTAGPHVLNVFGAPSEDDGNLSVDVDKRTFTGKWDDGDANDLPPANRSPNDSVAFTLVDPLSGNTPRDELCSGNLYVNIHSVEHGPGALRGQIIPSSGAC